MIGKIKKKKIAIEPAYRLSNIDLICPICNRMIPDSQKDAHHLIPKSKGGKATEFLHRICHRQIHAILTEAELANQFNHIEALISHPEMIRFIRWIENKPCEFYEKTRKSSRLRSS